MAVCWAGGPGLGLMATAVLLGPEGPGAPGSICLWLGSAAGTGWTAVASACSTVVSAGAHMADSEAGHTQPLLGRVSAVLDDNGIGGAALTAS